MDNLTRLNGMYRCLNDQFTIRVPEPRQIKVHKTLIVKAYDILGVSYIIFIKETFELVYCED